MKKNYLSEEEIDDITTAIYNDLTPAIYEDVSEDVVDNYNEQVVKELFKDKEYKRVGDSEFVITREGRIFNSKTIKYRKPTLTSVSLTVILGTERVSIQEFFEDNGWTFDLEEIARRYKNNNWGITVVYPYRSYFKSL